LENAYKCGSDGKADHVEHEEVYGPPGPLAMIQAPKEDQYAKLDEAQRKDVEQSVGVVRLEQGFVVLERNLVHCFLRLAEAMLHM
jgi:hypothetical protein